MCAVPVDENDPCYDETNYRVGKCLDTCVNKKLEVESDGEEMGDSGRQEVVKNTVRTKVTGHFSEKTKETGKQTNISNFFTTNNTRHGDFGFKRKLNDGIGVQSERPSKRKCDNKKTETDAKSDETGGCDKGRTVRVETIENNWRQQLAKDDLDVWFDYKKDGSYAVSLKCRVCTTFENNIKNMKGFNNKWITGCENYKLSAA